MTIAHIGAIRELRLPNEGLQAAVQLPRVQQQSDSIVPVPVCR
jgi:hypothetical protein